MFLCAQRTQVTTTHELPNQIVLCTSPSKQMTLSSKKRDTEDAGKIELMLGFHLGPTYQALRTTIANQIESHNAFSAEDITHQMILG